MSSISEQVTFRPAERICQATAELTLQKTNDFPHPLQRKSAPAQVTDDGNLGYVLNGIEAPVPLTAWNYHAALIPPLQLARGNAGEGYNLVRGKQHFHGKYYLFKTIAGRNV